MRDDVFLKIKWADKHFQDFRKLFRRWVRSDTYGFVIDHDPKTDEVLYRLSPEFTVPREFALIAGDVVQNLRSALDYLVFALARANGSESTHQTSFPIVEYAPSTPEEIGRFARKIEGVGEEARNLIWAIKPYKGGDNTLWRLHRLNNINKHRLLFTVGGFLDDWSIGQHIAATNPPLALVEQMGRAYVSDEYWVKVRQLSFPLKAGDVLHRDPPNTKPNKDVKFGIQIAINESGICEGEPLRDVLGISISKVLQVVRMFDGMY